MASIKPDFPPRTAQRKSWCELHLSFAWWTRTASQFDFHFDTNSTYSKAPVCLAKTFCPGNESCCRSYLVLVATGSSDENWPCPKFSLPCRDTDVQDVFEVRNPVLGIGITEQRTGTLRYGNLMAACMINQVTRKMSDRCLDAISYLGSFVVTFFWNKNCLFGPPVSWNQCEAGFVVG